MNIIFLLAIFLNLFLFGWGFNVLKMNEFDPSKHLAEIEKLKESHRHVRHEVEEMVEKEACDVDTATKEYVRRIIDQLKSYVDKIAVDINDWESHVAHSNEDVEIINSHGSSSEEDHDLEPIDAIKQDIKIKLYVEKQHNTSNVENNTESAMNTEQIKENIESDETKNMRLTMASTNDENNGNLFADEKPIDTVQLTAESPEDETKHLNSNDNNEPVRVNESTESNGNGVVSLETNNSDHVITAETTDRHLFNKIPDSVQTLTNADAARNSSPAFQLWIVASDKQSTIPNQNKSP